MKRRGGTARGNAMRSMLVVLGSLAFGYLTIQVGFKPYLEEAQLEQQRREALLEAQSANSQSQDGFEDSFREAELTSSDSFREAELTSSERFPESDKKL